MTLSLNGARDAFRMFDLHHRGWISEAQTGALVDSLGLMWISDAERAAFVKSMDPGATGRIELREFERGIQRRLPPPESPEELGQALAVLDAADAGLTAADLSTMLAKNGVDISSDNLQKLVIDITDGKPVISADHWRSVLTKKTSSTRKATKQ